MAGGRKTQQFGDPLPGYRIFRRASFSYQAEPFQRFGIFSIVFRQLIQHLSAFGQRGRRLRDQCCCPAGFTRERSAADRIEESIRPRTSADRQTARRRPSKTTLATSASGRNYDRDPHIPRRRDGAIQQAGTPAFPFPRWLQVSVGRRS